MKEIWQPIAECSESYEVSTLGRVRSKNRVDIAGRHRKGKVLSQSISMGYPYVLLRINGKSVNRRVHRLVAETFLGKPSDDCEVNHIDRNKLNNRVDNLEWCTHRENIYHRLDTDWICQK